MRDPLHALPVNVKKQRGGPWRITRMSGSARVLVEAHVHVHAEPRHVVEFSHVSETEAVVVLRHVDVDRARMSTGSET